MQLLRSIAPVFISIMALSANVSAQEDDVTQIRSLLERVAGLMQAGDLTPLDEIYAPGRGVHIIEGAGVNHGWEDYRDHHLAPELAAFENFSYRYFAIEPQVRGDTAYSAFRYELIADVESGHIEIEGRGTAILERMNGRWRIVHTHTSGRPK
ncbi:MAG: hypothetical protein COB36_09865 [Alphaproteobacteria bacterium]|nr:MAG: hypothetical protein COB36_09865 [Alphaproteobacteria bacterium]